MAKYLVLAAVCVAVTVAHPMGASPDYYFEETVYNYGPHSLRVESNSPSQRANKFGNSGHNGQVYMNGILASIPRLASMANGASNQLGRVSIANGVPSRLGSLTNTGVPGPMTIARGEPASLDQMSNSPVDSQDYMAHGPARLENLEPDSEVELLPGAQQPQQPPQQPPVAPNIPGILPGQQVYIIHMPVPGYRGYQPVYIVGAAPQDNAGYPPQGNVEYVAPPNHVVPGPVVLNAVHQVQPSYSPYPSYPKVGQVSPNYGPLAALDPNGDVIGDPYQAIIVYHRNPIALAYLQRSPHPAVVYRKPAAASTSSVSKQASDHASESTEAEDMQNRNPEDKKFSAKMVDMKV